jgi:peroxiredoxin family protein
MAASILATGAAAMGMEVEVFLTTWGLEAFRKGNYKTNMRISKEYEDYGPIMMQQMMAKKVPSWMENLKGAKEIGDVKVFACSMTMELFDMKLDDLEPIVDDVTGVATFVERARESQITLFI